MTVGPLRHPWMPPLVIKTFAFGPQVLLSRRGASPPRSMFSKLPGLVGLIWLANLALILGRYGWLFAEACGADCVASNSRHN